MDFDAYPLNALSGLVALFMPSGMILSVNDLNIDIDMYFNDIVFLLAICLFEELNAIKEFHCRDNKLFRNYIYLSTRAGMELYSYSPVKPIYINERKRGKLSLSGTSLSLNMVFLSVYSVTPNFPFAISLIK